jgi:hypothetical protein
LKDMSGSKEDKRKFRDGEEQAGRREYKWQDEKLGDQAKAANLANTPRLGDPLPSPPPECTPVWSMQAAAVNDSAKQSPFERHKFSCFEITEKKKVYKLKGVCTIDKEIRNSRNTFFSLLDSAHPCGNRYSRVQYTWNNTRGCREQSASRGSQSMSSTFSPFRGPGSN